MMAPRSTGRPVAYLRRSVTREDAPGAVSHEAQIEAVRDMAGPDLTDDRILQDWGVSGRKGRDKRPGYDQLLTLIEAGEVSIVYSYSMSRLARSVGELSRLLELCDAHGVPVRTVDREVDTETATGRMITHILAAVDQFIAEIAREHSIKGVAIARKNGRQIGRPRYGRAGGLDKHGQKIEVREGESVDAVVAAFREAGSYLGAAKLLTERGIPSRSGKKWDTTVIRRILRGDERRGTTGALGRAELPAKRRGAPAVGRRILAGLLVCHCKTTLTAGHPGWFYCRSGHLDPTHPKPYNVKEADILPTVREWVSWLGPVIRGEHADAPDPADVARRHSELDAKARYIRTNAIELQMPPAEVHDRLAEIEAERDKIETTGALTGFAMLDKVDWSAEPGTVNGQLRRVFKWIELGADLRPVKAVWHPTARYGEEGPSGPSPIAVAAGP